MFLKKLIIAGAMTGLISSAAYAAECGPSGQSIRILASDFPAIHAVAGTAEKNCASGASEFSRNHTTEARQIMNAALTPNPAEYTSVIVANSTLTQLMNDGLVRPLNGLIDKYGQNIPDNLKITIDGNNIFADRFSTTNANFVDSAFGGHKFYECISPVRCAVVICRDFIPIRA